MTTKRLIFTFHFFAGRLTLTCLLLLMAVVYAYGGVIELLSDDCISDITAGNASNSVITNFYATPTSAYIDSEPRWWGDMDGFGSSCTSNPGFVVTNVPYTDFQYNTFKYSFKSQAELDRFVRDLPTLGGAPINVINTDYIRSNPSMGNYFLNDGSRPRIQEIIITTDQPINGNFVRAHNGEVIAQQARFDLEFLPPYALTVTTHHSSVETRTTLMERSLSFRNYDRYEWMTRRSSAPLIRNPDGTFSFIDLRDETYNFGAVFLESGKTGDAPVLSSTGQVLVPPDTSFLKTTIFNDIHLFCPAFGMSIGLAPRGAPVPSSLVIGDQAYYPDLNRYQELGLVDIRNLNIYLKGGNNIYVYPNEPLPICQ